MYYFILFVFSKILRIASSSSNIQIDPGIEFCQWEPFVERTKHECISKCLTSYGFKHPVTNSLICYNLTSPVKPIFGYSNPEVVLDSCECGAMLSSGNQKCKPSKIYDKQNIIECMQTCPKLTAYITERKKTSELVVCEDSTKVKELKLGVMISRDKVLSSKSNTDIYKYTCKCGIGMPEEVQFAYPQRSYKGRAVGGNLAAVCPQVMPYEDSVLCASRCLHMKGFLTKSQQLICFHLTTQAKVVSKSKEPCECGHKTKKRGVLENCDPALTFKTNVSNPEECELECSKHTIFRHKSIEGFFEIIWCDRKIKSNKIIKGLNWKRGDNYNLEGNIVDFSCICGLKTIPIKDPGEDSGEGYENDGETPAELRLKNKNRKTKEFVATCSAGPFEMRTKRLCKNSCRRTKAYFISNNPQNELICYDEIKEATRIPSFVKVGDAWIEDKATCKCGAKFNDNDKLRRYAQPCIPEIKYPLMKYKYSKNVVRGQSKRCRRACRKYVAIVTHSSPKYQILRCESESSPLKIYKSLDWKIIDSTVIARNDNNKSSIYQCVCGLTSSSFGDDENINLNRDDDSTSLPHAKFVGEWSKENNSNLNRGASSSRTGFDVEMQVRTDDRFQNENQDTQLQVPLTNDSWVFQNTLRDNENSNHQPAIDLNVPSTEQFCGFKNHERENFSIPISPPFNTDVTNKNEGTSFPLTTLDENSQFGFGIQQETCDSNVDSLTAVNNNIVILHESDPETCEAIEPIADEFTEPVKDVDIPPGICTYEKNFGESSKGKQFLLPDLNIPLQFSAQDMNSTCSSDSEFNLNPPPSKRKRSFL